MKTEELFLTREQAKHLQELGLDMSDAAFGHFHCPNGDWDIFPIWMLNRDNPEVELIPTYTLQEVFDKLPKVLNDKYYLVFNHNNIEYVPLKGEILQSFDITNCDWNNVYKMLCWVLENNFINKNNNKK